MPLEETALDSLADEAHSWVPVARMLQLTAHKGGEGLLVAGQVPAQIPFVPKRFFVIQGVPSGGVRGGHAHLECHQLLVCLGGQIEVEWEDLTGEGSAVLADSSRAVYLPPLVWAQQTYSTPDSVLLVLASEPYKPQDYVDDPVEAHVLRWSLK
jgi:UDP-2-acetamido-3-amino-2,3-dideoxy-glucuronate N-acetyltransferase